MSQQLEDSESFAKLMTAIEPWRSHLVLIGGWCHRVHRMHPKATKHKHPVVHTRDTDLLIATRPAPEADIRTALLAHGFRENLSGDGNPAPAHYYLGEENSGFYAEFLLPEVPRRVPVFTESVAQISAQVVKYTNVLALDPWIVTVGLDDDLKMATPIDVLVANPLCFLVQKFLIKSTRSKAKRAQDLLYVYDTLQHFGERLEEMRETWLRVVMPVIGDKLAGRITQAWTESANSEFDIATAAAEIGRGRTPQLTANTIQGALRYAYLEIIEG